MHICALAKPEWTRNQNQIRSRSRKLAKASYVIGSTGPRSIDDDPEKRRRGAPILAYSHRLLQQGGRPQRSATSHTRFGARAGMETRPGPAECADLDSFGTHRE